MQSFHGSEFAESLFVSPILDMKTLIQNMMMWTGVTEEMLKDKQLIETNFGETLSWKYYQFVKEHPITEWNCKTHILYADFTGIVNKHFTVHRHHNSTYSAAELVDIMVDCAALVIHDDK